MTYVMGSAAVRIGASVSMGTNSKIIYYVRPDDDIIEFVFGDHNELELDMTEDGLRCCIATFAEALNAFEAATASQG